ncbi:unnamed protein product [Paramecium primaurelia]|uniref:F-box domain-containing protein n=1 Tax=Paramecium primaurelia TaxID=5886 RepID=A0A8S1NAD4_PARPR|nr:unnamed protein product [Paramecium primaurelia]
MMKKQQIRKPPSYDPFTLLTNDYVRIILTYLNVFDLVRSARVCRRWREIIEKDPLMFEHANLENIDSSKPLFPILKIFSRDKTIISMKLPPHATQTDTAYMFMQLPQSIQYLKFTNINMEFSKIFTRKFPNFKSLTLVNTKNRKKPFDEIEMKSFLTLKSAQELHFYSLPWEDSFISIFSEFNLQVLCIYDCPYLTNDSLYLISKHCKLLQKLLVGGSEQVYNAQISKSGFQIDLMNLKSLEIRYCSRIGDQSLDIIANSFPTLTEFALVRNNFEKCAKISDQAFKNMQDLQLQRLSIIYTRKLRDQAHINIAKFHQLRYLCLRNCPLQYDVSIWNENCPLLEELDVSGDSWVSQSFVLGIAQHQNLKIFWLGHFEHGDLDCDTKLQQYPPEGLFLESIFKKETSFPKLHTLHLEHDCNLTYWLYARISKLRPKLFFR